MINTEKAGGVRTLHQYHYWLNTAERPHTANMSWSALICLIVRGLMGEKQAEGGRLKAED